MTYAQSALRGLILLGMMAMASGCVIAEHGDGYRGQGDGYRGHGDEYREHEGYREGYYDRDHHRYYHDHGWRECGERDEHCH